MNTRYLLLVVLGMSVVTYVPRVLPFALLSRRRLPDWFLVFLSYIPVAILSALLLPSLMVANGQINFGPGNQSLMAALPTLVVAYITRSLYLTVLAGLVTMAALRMI